MMTYEDLKLLLTPEQRKAAELIVANDFAPKGEKRKLDEIAFEVGVDRRTLYNWRQNADFTRFMSAISDNKLDNHRSLADSQLIKLIAGTSNNGVASIKALELFYKLNGRLEDKRTVTINDEERKPTMTRAEVSKGLADLERFVN